VTLKVNKHENFFGSDFRFLSKLLFQMQKIDVLHQTNFYVTNIEENGVASAQTQCAGNNWGFWCFSCETNPISLIGFSVHSVSTKALPTIFPKLQQVLSMR